MAKVFYEISFFEENITGGWEGASIFAVPSAPTYRFYTVVGIF